MGGNFNNKGKKMKTETQIAEENIKKSETLMATAPMPSMSVESFETVKEGNKLLGECQGHKASCQRDVPKLKKIKESIVYVENELTHHLLDEIIEDKEQAISKYKEKGI